MHRILTASVYNYRRRLRRELQKRRKQNPQYSLRAFARDLRVSPSMLSEILNRQKGLSREMGQHIAVSLELDAVESEAFLQSVILHHSPSELQRHQAFLKLRHLDLSCEQKGFERLQPQKLDGVWRATVRLSSSGATPLYWDSGKSQTYFIFAQSKMEYVSRNAPAGQFHIFGSWEYEGEMVHTPTTHCDVFNRPESLPFPWLAESHKILKIEDDLIQLSTAAELLQTPICPPGDSLETIWQRVKT